MIPLKNIAVVLVEPRISQNIGATARAMKTMGFSKLYLVNPAPYRNSDTYYTAWGAQDILDQAVCFGSLTEALKEFHFVVGTTQRKRKHRDRTPRQTPQDLADHLSRIPRSHKVAILFGRENNGLVREELMACNIIATVPQHTLHPSLNLSQAVMIFCYELSRGLRKMETAYQFKMASFSETEKLHEHFEKFLGEMSFESDHKRHEFYLSLKKILSKIPLESRDIRAFHSFLNMAEKKFYSPEEWDEIRAQSRRASLTRA